VLKDYTVNIHIKDAVLSDGHIRNRRAPGDGGIDFNVYPTAYRQGERGFLSIEAQLAALRHAYQQASARPRTCARSTTRRDGL